MTYLKHLLALAVALTWGAICIGQGSGPLTIEEAVTAGGGSLITENIKDIQWIPGTQMYSYRDEVKGGNAVLAGHIDGRDPVVLMTQAKVANAYVAGGFVQPDLIPPFEWVDSKTVMFTWKGQYWELDYSLDVVRKRISCSTFAQNRILAPDKRKVGFTIFNDLFIGTYQDDTVRVTSNSLVETSGQAVSRFEFGINKGIFWSDNSNRLAYYHKDESNVTDYDLMDYRSIPAASTPTPYPMAGQGSETVWVKVYDVTSKETITLETGDEEGEYITSVTWAAGDKEVLLGHLSRTQNDFTLSSYDAKTGEKLGDLFSEHDDEYVEPEQEPYMLKGKRKGEFLWFSERDGFNHIYHYGPKGKLINQLTSGKRVMQSVIHVDAENDLIYVSGTDSPLESVVYQVSLKGAKMLRVTEETGTHSVMISPDATHFIDSYRSVAVPRKVMLKRIDGTMRRVLLEAPNPLLGRQVGQTELLTLKGVDGIDLHARIIKPSDFDPSKKYPVLVYVYNGPHVQLVRDTWLGGASMWMHHLSERGYIIFTLDGRGSMNRGVEFEQAVHGDLGNKEVDDQMVGVSYLKELPYVDEDRMAIHGWSYGGFMTLNLMLKEAGAFKVGVAGGAVTDWRFYEVMYTERYMDSPEDNAVGYEQSALINRADQLQGDLMMIHCTSDDVVVPQHFMVMLNSFINADKQIDVMLYPGHGHNVRGPDRVHLFIKIFNYLDAKL